MSSSASTDPDTATSMASKKDAANNKAKSKTPKKAGQNNQETGSGFLGFVEKLGNKLPDPFWLFVIIGGLVAVTSWIGTLFNMQATDPATGDPILVKSLLSTEGISMMVGDAVENFVTFPALGLIIVVMLGVAVAEQTGLISAVIRAMVAKVGPRTLTFAVALAGVTGSVASDAVYVILIPLGAMSFRAMGRSPIVGAMVAFAASSAGFNSSLVLNITDVLLAGISSTAAGIVEPDYEVSPLANYFFVFFSAIVLALIITAVTELYMNKKAHELVNHDEINYEELSFDRAAGANNSEDDDLFDTAENSSDGAESDKQQSKEQSDEDLEESLKLSPREVKALVWTGIASIVMLAAYFALLFFSGSPLQGPGGEVMESPLIKDVAVPITLAFFFLGLVYGVIAGTINSPGDIPEFMAQGLKTLLPMMVLFFAVSQFLAWFQWSNLGNWTAIRGAELLQRWDLPPLVMFGAFVLLVAVVNLFITSGSAQWALMAPVVVPMFMYVNVSPEVTQMLFRIGDSPSNIITPMSPYFALALTFLQRYYSKSGIGTLMSLAIPYSVAMLVGWFLFFCLWWFTGLPLGPGTPMDYTLPQ
ncbi:AbgT family transporter [Corynebacterium dentalis]|uniref:AbgT family transporter n=1 Tax=Corynebacterium dentalis TaxID=2014528 RepID=UPI00289FA7D4|nr:SLC13 family permease [Corynebacterium dentalis]